MAKLKKPIRRKSVFKKPTTTYIQKSKGYVAFIDILGFGELLKDDKFQSKIELLVKRLRSRAEYDGKYYPGIKYIAISDSIIITAEYDEGYALVRKVGQVQNALLKIGFATRGGMSFGEILTYSGDTGENIFGKTYLDAYDAERKIAIYPRVVIDKKARAELRTDIQIGTDRPLKTYILSDPDGIDFVNQFSSDVIGIKGKIPETRKKSAANCEIYQEAIDDGLRNSDESAKMKWRWLQNQFAAQFPDFPE